MASAKHRKPRTPFAPMLRRAGGAGVAAAAAVAAIGVSAPGASADSVWDRVAACESGGNWSINTGNGYYGGLQFSPSTWSGFGGGQYAPNAHQASKSQQIAIAQKVLATQGPGAWPTCSVKAGLTRSNGGGGGYAPAPANPAPANPAPAPAQPRQSEAPSRSAGPIHPVVSVSAPLVKDGIRGPLTNATIQRWVGTHPDGIFGPITTKALQNKVGTTPDGVWGPKSQAALQDYLGIDRDGSSSMNARTVSALQAHLNSNVIG
ncbi:transglycosylase family protein [Ornithinimicrobium faecis]|uniref:Transglycosylase family protein n=1 Tax=Ornithinimicrobium faecis TaxID=2934158 RepID=A0ABY4YVF5_9MICO|nr:transglycosylase family protein [Ornithinimicrobium sp. HY1793]USQ80758.1 transglycosylase family protein [Ornithinimicrobium sp. HY1793]